MVLNVKCVFVFANLLLNGETNVRSFKTRGGATGG